MLGAAANIPARDIYEDIDVHTAHVRLSVTQQTDQLHTAGEV